ncbi:MAG: LCP family protein, partial [Oscillospiraceae bacterium]|nr:LCP family protein [Oscillospiraceae bacterium]
MDNTDLPRPRSQKEQPAAPPKLGKLKPLPKERPETAKPQSTPEKPKQLRRTSSRDEYASDTAEFTVPPYRPQVYDSYDEPDNDYPHYDHHDYECPAQERRYDRRPDYDHRDYDRRPAAPPPERRTSAPKRKRRKHRHHRSILGRIVRWLCTIAVIIFALYSAVALLLISRLEKVPSGHRTVTNGMIDPIYVRTILLIGTDSRDLTQERGRSDSMILLTLNSKTHTIGMNSLMRDAYVDIPGHDSNKLNASYSIGGPELLMDTIEQNYNVSVDDYLCVSFTGFAGVIDALGGVELTLSDSEAQAVNEILQSEVNALMGDDPMADFLPSGGTFVLDGKQALSYARIRYVGNADFERTSRQREVMTQLISSAKSRLVTAAPKLMDSALPHFTTNMSTAALYLLSLRLPLRVDDDMNQQQIP